MKNINLTESVPDIWDFWITNGINTSQEISVIFTFYSAFKDESLNFVTQLETLGYKAQRKSKRTMIIFKGYEIIAEKTKVWTQKDLIETIGILESAAKQNETILEGYFAAEPT